MMTNQIIAAVSLGVTLCVMFLPGLRSCWKSIRRKPLLTLLIFLLIAAIFLGSPRGVRSLARNPVDSIRAIRMSVVSLVVILSFFLLLIRRASIFPVGNGLKSFFIYALFAMASAFYSSYPLLSLWKGFEVFSFILFAFAVHRYITSPDDISDILDILWVSLLFLVITALIGIIIYPELARYKSLSNGSMVFVFEGVFPSINANTLTQVAGMMAALSLIRVFSDDLISHKIGFAIVFLTAFAVMLLAHSRTSILSFVVSLMATLFFLRKKKLFLFSVWLGAIAVLSGPFVEVILSYLYRGQNIKLFYSMSGRTSFWPLVWDKIGEAPMFGHGFYTAHRMMWGGGSVDNTYLEVLLGLGLVGLFFFSMSVFCVSLDIFRTRPRKSEKDLTIWLQMLIVFVFLVIRSLTGPSFQILHFSLLCYVLLAIMSHTYKSMEMSKL